MTLVITTTLVKAKSLPSYNNDARYTNDTSYNYEKASGQAKAGQALLGQGHKCGSDGR